VGVFQIGTGCQKIELEERHAGMFLSVQVWQHINTTVKLKKGRTQLKSETDTWTQ